MSHVDKPLSSPQTTCSRDMDAAPLGRKLIAINPGGVACFATLSSANKQDFIAWAPLPKLKKVELIERAEFQKAMKLANKSREPDYFTKPQNRVRDADIFTMRSAGKKFTAIAKKYNLTGQRVRQIYETQRVRIDRDTNMLLGIIELIGINKLSLLGENISDDFNLIATPSN